MIEFRLLGSGLNRPIEGRYLTSLHVNVNGDWFLFDAPENIQVQIQRYGGSLNMEKIFLTGLRPETTFGLPGLLSTLQFLSKEEPDLRDVDLFVPEIDGGIEYAKKVVDLATLPVDITEVSLGETVLENAEYKISAFRTDQGEKGPGLGYRLEESERRGRFDRGRAEELGVPVGPKFGELHDGNPVELDDGRIIQPDQVVGPPRPGLSLAYTGATEYPEQIPRNAKDVDVLFVDGGSSTRADQQESSGHMNAYEAGTIAGAADASMVVLTHVRHVYYHSHSELVEDLNDAYDGPYLIGEDGVRGVIGSNDHDEKTPGLRDVLSELEGHGSVNDFPS